MAFIFLLFLLNDLFTLANNGKASKQHLNQALCCWSEARLLFTEALVKTSKVSVSFVLAQFVTVGKFLGTKLKN